MARRTSNRPRKPTRRVVDDFKPTSPWPHIEWFLENGGNISIGDIDPIKYTAVAADEHTMLAALVRRKNETFTELMSRLDHAVDLAVNQETFTDEING